MFFAGFLHGEIGKKRSFGEEGGSEDCVFFGGFFFILLDVDRGSVVQIFWASFLLGSLCEVERRSFRKGNGTGKLGVL